MRRLAGLMGSFIVAVLVLAQGAAVAQNVPRNRTLVVAQNFDPQSLWPNGTTASTNLNPAAVRLLSRRPEALPSPRRRPRCSTCS